MKIAVVGTHGFGKNVLVNMLGDYCQNLGETYVHGTEFNYMDLLNSPDPIDHAFMEITKPEISIYTKKGELLRLDACPCGGELQQDRRGFLYCKECSIIYE